MEFWSWNPQPTVSPDSLRKIKISENVNINDNTPIVNPILLTLFDKPILLVFIALWVAGMVD